MISCDIHDADSVYDPEKHNPERTQFRRDTIPNVRDPEWNGFDPNGHNLEWPQSPIDMTPNGLCSSESRKQFRNLFHNKAV